MDLVSIFKALADANRLRALAALRDQALCDCQIVELLGLAPSTVSKHLSILAGAGLVTSDKRGRWVYYGLSTDDASAMASVRRLVLKLAEEDAQCQADQTTLPRILELDPEALCRVQSERQETRCAEPSACATTFDRSE